MRDAGREGGDEEWTEWGEWGLEVERKFVGVKIAGRQKVQLVVTSVRHGIQVVREHIL